METKTIECFSSVKTRRSLRKFSCSSVRLPSEQSQLHPERVNIQTMSLTRDHGASPSVSSGESNTVTSGSILTDGKESTLESKSGESELDVSVESGYSSDNTPTKTNSCVTSVTDSRCNFMPLATRYKRSRKFKKSSSDKLLKTVLKRNQDRVNRELALRHSPEKIVCTRLQTDHPLLKFTSAAHDLDNIGYVSSSCVSKLIARRLGGYVLIDGRCPLAYRDSHIQGSVNLYTQEMLYHYYAAHALKPLAKVPAAVIFVSNDIHGKSQRMATFIRDIDISVNKHRRSKLLFPRLYILNDSYINFSNSFSGCCKAYI